MASKLKVTLIPWDPHSTSHREVLTIQRDECGWGKEKVEGEWRDEQIKGSKCIFWIVLHSNDLRDPQSLDDPFTLEDTALSFYMTAHKVSRMSFIPIGHISLDSANTHTGSIDLDLPLSGVFWINTFYVRHEFQSQGAGRAAMDMVEEMATKEPLNATTLALDTIQKNDQLREDFALATFGRIPKVANEDWYSRRGYQVIRTVENYYRNPDKFGKIWDMKTVFMRKELRDLERPAFNM